MNALRRLVRRAAISHTVWRSEQISCRATPIIESSQMFGALSAKKRIASAWLTALLVPIFVVACGGGGGGGDGAGGSGTTPPPTSFAFKFEEPYVSVAPVEGSVAYSGVTGTLTGLAAGTQVWVGVQGGDALLLNAVLSTGTINPYLTVALTVSDKLAPGTYRDTLKLHICEDEACRKPYPGSPFSTDLVVTVKPNIHLPAEVRISRSGAEPAPRHVLDAELPVDAGDVVVSLDQVGSPMRAFVEGGRIIVETYPVRAGSYVAMLNVSGRDSRYHARGAIRYDVLPPPGGEKSLAVETLPGRVFSVPLGQKALQRIVATRPTWTNDFSEPQLSASCDPAFRLLPTGSDSWELSFDSAGHAVGSYLCDVKFSAGEFGGYVSSSMLVEVGLAFNVQQITPIYVTNESAIADLRRVAQVVMADGGVAQWSAVSSAPWLRLLRTSGTTGRDSLELEIDQSQLATLAPAAEAKLTVSVDRPGVPPQEFKLAVSVGAPVLRRIWPGVLIGSSGRIYLDGVLLSRILADGKLSVTGATLKSAKLVRDAYYAGDKLVLQLDVSDAVPGGRVEVAYKGALIASRQSLAVKDSAAYPSGFVAKAFGQTKPPSFSARSDALFFAAADRVFRLGLTGSTWALQSAPVPGVIDVDPSPSEARLATLSPGRYTELDPADLTERFSVALPQMEYGVNYAYGGSGQFDSKSIFHTTDGNTWAQLVRTTGGTINDYGVALLNTGSVLDSFYTTALDTSRGVLFGSASAIQMLGSAGRGVIMATPARSDGVFSVWMNLAESITRHSFTFSPPARRALVAVSDDGRVTITDDGFARLDGAQSNDLTRSVPPGHTAAGYGLSADGHFALVYSYRMTGSEPTAVASEPTLSILDLRVLDWTGGAKPVVTATLRLEGVPGCGSPRATGETCEHRAHILVDPLTRNAFVLGPRGIAIAALPPEMKLASRVRGKSQSTAGVQRLLGPAIVTKRAP